MNAVKSFAMAAECLNFSTVAQRRNTVQSAVSAHISKLEAELNRTLFERGRGQAMRLTPEGEAFAVYARRLLALSHEAVEAIQTSRSRSILRLGTTVTFAMSMVTEVLAQFAAQCPEVQIHIQCDRSNALLTHLDNDDIDIAFMIDQGKRQGRSFVYSEPLVWAAGADFDLAGQDTVPLAFQSDGRDLRQYALEALDKDHRAGHVVHLSPHPIGVRAFVLAGMALTVMPRSAMVEPLRPAPSNWNLPSLPSIGISAYKQTGVEDENTQLLIDLLRAALSRHDGSPRIHGTDG